MKTIRILPTALVFLTIKFSTINCASDPAQADTAEALRASEADLQREKTEFIKLTEGKIAAFRRSLGEMKALAGSVSSPAGIEINKHSEEMERQIKAAEKNLSELMAPDNPAFNQVRRKPASTDFSPGR